MIKKEYIQPTVKEIKVNIPAVLAANSPGEDVSSEEVDNEEEIASLDADFGFEE